MGDKKAYRGDMKFHYKDIDMAVKQHIKDEIAFEKSKNIEDLIFFSSHTISLKVFKDGTRKLKKKLKNFDLMEVSFFEEEIERFIFEHHLHVELNSEKYLYLCKALLKAHIVINEAIIKYFLELCRGAHSWDYLESRAEQIYSLLCDEQ